MPVATQDGSGSLATSFPVNDCYGSKTATADTAFARVIPPKTGVRARVAGFVYTAGTTAHTISVMVCIEEVKVTSEAAAGQAVVVINNLPSAYDGSAVAAADWFVLQYEDGSWNAHKVASISGLSVTMDANFTKKIPTGSKAFFMGAPADHTDRQFTVNASQTLTVPSGGTAAADGQPILVHSNNVTAAGILQSLGWSYGAA